VEKIRNAAGEGASQNEALSAHVWLRLSQLMGLPEGAPLEHVTVVSGRGGKRGLPEMYFGNASVGVCTGRLRAGEYGDVRGVRDAIRPGMRRALMRRSKFLMLTEATFRAGVSAFDFDIDAFMEGRMVWCNNLTDIYLKLYELDFGVGTPTLALPPELNDIVQIQCSRPGADGEAAGGKRRGDVRQPAAEHHGEAQDARGEGQARGARLRPGRGGAGRRWSPSSRSRTKSAPARVAVY
jgi:hypothetical protein